jgi:D-threo-aldose 1-dehydrogenase
VSPDSQPTASGEVASRSLPSGTLRLTEVSLGCAQLGNLYKSISDEQAHATVDAAWSDGIRYFDTAPHYGLGLSERRLGAALAGRPRDQYVVSTKVGRLLEPVVPPRPIDDEDFEVAGTHRRVWDFSREGVLRSLEGSLERLALDRIDVVFIHDPDDHWDDAYGRAYPALEELRAQGLVSAIGAGMNQTTMLTEFARNTDMDVLMLAGRYTLLEQGALDDLLPVCLERGVGIVAAGIFNSGLLSHSRPTVGARYNYVEASPSALEGAKLIAELCDRGGTSLPAAAIAFPLGHPAVTSVCLGARSPGQIHENVELYRRGVDGAVWGGLKSAGLLRPDAPVPGP